MAATLFEMSAVLRLDRSDYDRQLSGAVSETESQGSKLGGILSGLGTVAKTGLAVLGTSLAAVSAVVAKSVKQYAEYEQLWGGVQKLYGTAGKSIEEYAQSVGKSVDQVRGEYSNLEKAQNIMLQQANEAYKTSGMSANTYMEQATSFSASLINSLNGDTVAAAKQTDVAMRAMSDNFNTFGGDIQNVQNAFQGFAKQNYTIGLMSVA